MHVDNAKSKSILQEAVPVCYFIKNLYREEREVLYRTEMDSHADTCVAGAMYLLIRDEGKTVSVFSYNDEYKPVTVTIGTAATLWEDPTSGQPYILVINQALFFGDKVQMSLLNPNQLRANGLRVDDVPRQFLRNSTHSIYFPNEDVRIPLCLDGIMSGFKSRKPTMQEVDEIPHLELTADSIWKPSDKYNTI